MTRRERLERKIEKRQDWADAARAKAQSASSAAMGILEHIPPGQPVLVGHHSEKRHRRDLGRVDSNLHKAAYQQALAEHHEVKAAGLAAQLDRTIFSDDVDAVDRLQERIEEREAEAARMVAVNKAWRKSKGDVEQFAQLAGISSEQAQKVAATIEQAYSWDKQPYPAYELNNLRNRIRADKERLKTIQAQQARAEKAENNGGCLIEGTDYVRVTFAEKPDRDVLTALKAAGFRWSGGSWYGYRANLPALD